MSKRTYGQVRCYVCDKDIPSNGAAKTSHFRKHVREGLLIEVHKEDGVYFEDRICLRCERPMRFHAGVDCKNMKRVGNG